jgi:hypothetical protein
MRPLHRLTSPEGVGTFSNMKALELLRTRIVLSGTSFAELVLWRLPVPLAGCNHRFKYRLDIERWNRENGNP